VSTSFLRWTAAALAGLAFAVAIGIAASTLASERIGLSSEPLSAGGELAPAAVKQPPKRKHEEPATPAPVSPPVAPVPKPVPVAPPADDSGHQEGGHESEPDHDGDD